MVSPTAEASASMPTLQFERQQIVGQLAQPTAIVEIAAKLGLPLRAVQVLVSEMIGDGLLRQHATVVQRRQRTAAADPPCRRRPVNPGEDEMTPTSTPHAPVAATSGERLADGAVRRDAGVDRRRLGCARLAPRWSLDEG